MSSKIMFVTDSLTKEGEPLGGGAGHVMRGVCSQAGIDLAECFVTSVVPESLGGRTLESLCQRTRDNSLPGFPWLKRGFYLPASFAPNAARLRAQIERQQPNIIVTLGNLAMLMVCKHTGIDRWRGSPTLDHTGQFKTMATWSPQAVIQQWTLRPILFMDLQKVLRESAFPQIKRPKRYIHLEPSLADIAGFYEQHIAPARFVAADIETKAGTITEIGFATSPSRAIVIPFWSRARGNYWKTQAEEVEAWQWVRRILAEKPTVGQNFQYDMQYLWRKMGIPCPMFAGDTMLLQHTLYPEMKKGLGFLGSLLTDEPSWKFMRTDHDTMKKEDT
jgi:uracil-DNA glycosylase